METRYAHPCAACGKHTFSYALHLHSDTTYHWVCDSCGIEMTLTFTNNGTSVVQIPTGQRCDRTLALFEFVDAPFIRFIHHGILWSHHEDNVYWYHEHTCPTNVLRCAEIYINGKPDIHGMFRLIKEIVITGPNAVPEDDAMAELSTMAEQSTQDT